MARKPARSKLRRPKSKPKPKSKRPGRKPAHKAAPKKVARKPARPVRRPPPRWESASRNLVLLGHSDQGGRADGTQVMVNGGYAYVAHVFSGGVTVLDVRDPRAPKPVNFLPVHPKSWSIHLQSFGDLLLVVEEYDFFKATVQNYYAASIADIHSSKFGANGVDYSAGLRVYDIKDRAKPRPIGFMPTEGLGLHRLWWSGDRYVYATALLDGYTDHILLIIDLADPARPTPLGRWWLPGMWKAGGETNQFEGRVALHHAIVAGDTAYAAWRNGGVTLLDVMDKSAPKLIAHRNWSPPFAGGTHTALPIPDRSLLVVADEATGDIAKEPLKYTWMLDIRAPRNPITIATMPVPAERDYFKKGGQFGPHNLWENRPEGFRSSTTIFATYQSAGLRVFDIADQYRPREIGHFVANPPAQWLDPRANMKRVLHSSDLYVTKDGLVFVTDYNAGMHILQWNGE